MQETSSEGRGRAQSIANTTHMRFLADIQVHCTPHLSPCEVCGRRRRHHNRQARRLIQVHHTWSGAVFGPPFRHTEWSRGDPNDEHVSDDNTQPAYTPTANDKMQKNVSSSAWGIGTRPRYLIVCLSPLLILTLCGPERVLVVSTEPPNDLSCLTTPGSAVPETGLLPVPLTRCTLRVHAGVCRLQH